MFWPLFSPKPRMSSVKSEEPSRLWRPYTPPILRIAWFTSAAPALRMSAAVITVALIGSRAGSLAKRAPSTSMRGRV